MQLNTVISFLLALAHALSSTGPIHLVTPTHPSQPLCRRHFLQEVYPSLSHCPVLGWATVIAPRWPPNSLCIFMTCDLLSPLDCKLLGCRYDILLIFTLCIQLQLLFFFTLKNFFNSSFFIVFFYYHLCLPKPCSTSTHPHPLQFLTKLLWNDHMTGSLPDRTQDLPRTLATRLCVEAEHVMEEALPAQKAQKVELSLVNENSSRSKPSYHLKRNICYQTTPLDLASSSLFEGQMSHPIKRSYLLLLSTRKEVGALPVSQLLLE